MYLFLNVLIFFHLFFLVKIHVRQ